MAKVTQAPVTWKRIEDGPCCELCMWSGGSGVERTEGHQFKDFVCDSCISALNTAKDE